MNAAWLALPDGLSDPARRLVEHLRTMKDGSELSLAKIGARTHYSRASWERWLNGKRLITEDALTAFAAMVDADAAPLLDLLRQALAEAQAQAQGQGQSQGAQTDVGAARTGDAAGHRTSRPARAVPAKAPPAPHVHSRSTRSTRPTSPGWPAWPTSVNSVAYSGGSQFQLPADIRVFAGRERELDELAALVPAPDYDGPVAIASVDGMAGIGKSALAVRAAHRMREAFPDGQLFLDLHGHTAGLQPMTAGDALDWLLRALGVPPQLIPQELQARAASYRDRLADTRTLIILDNASSTAQVRPLLPASPGCLVLVTSRKRLTGLDDAHPLSLDTLPAAEAIDLLHQVAGPGRIATDHPAIDELVALCGNLPLAIRITAARLRHHRALRIEDIVDQLRDEKSRLDRLQDEDRSLAAVFDLSYQHLASDEQHLFRRLGLIPGPDLDTWAAANLADTDYRSTHHLLEALVDHNLLTQHIPGRYRFHDLVRLYAKTLCAHDPIEERNSALNRLLDYYEVTALIADRHLARHTRPASGLELPGSAAVAVPMTTELAGRAVAAPELPERTDSLVWMRAESGNILAAIDQVTHAATGDRPSRAIALTVALAAFFQQEGPWPQAAALHSQAADAARDLGDRLSEANALSDLGRVRHMTRDFTAGTDALSSALTIYQDLGHRLGEANALSDLGRVHYLVGDYTLATELLESALTTYRDLADRRGEANALSDLGRVERTTGEFSVAGQLMKNALTIYQDLGDRQGEANVLRDLGRVHYLVGDYPTATELLEQACANFHAHGDRQNEANALNNLGQVRHATGDYEAAAELHKQALSTHKDLGDRLGEANALSNLGRVHHESGDFEAATELHRQALAIYQKLGTRLGEANAFANLGRAHRATGDYPTAAEMHEQALAIYRSLGDRQGQAETLNNMGALAADANGPREARVIYLQALDLAREIQSLIDEARALEGAARAAVRIGDRAAALPDLRKAVAIYQRIGAAEAAPTAEFLTELYG